MEYLFSYGTLQQEEVQLETFDRKLEGKEDFLPNYVLSSVKITDPRVVELSGSDVHHILERTDNPKDMVKGSIFKVTKAELLQADEYEVDDYKRIKVKMVSGEEAWVYTDANE